MATKDEDEEDAPDEEEGIEDEAGVYDNELEEWESIYDAEFCEAGI